MATTPRRGLPFVWVTWVTKIAAGRQQCPYPAWLRAHFKDVEEFPGDFDLDRWKADHDVRVEKRKKEFELDGAQVRVENENWLRVKGETALLIGKPDLIARLGGLFTIADSKSKQATDDLWQMWIYLYMLPKAWQNPGLRVIGELFYADGTRVSVQPEEFDSARKQTFFSVVRMAGQPEPPKKVPSLPDCAHCNLVNCDERVATFGEQVDSAALPVTTGDF